MSDFKYRNDNGLTDDVYDDIPQALIAAGWHDEGEGLWSQDGELLRESEALEWEEIVKVYPFKARLSGTIRARLEDTIYATDADDAHKLAKELLEMVSLYNFNTEPPDASDFDFDVKEATA